MTSRPTTENSTRSRSSRPKHGASRGSSSKAFLPKLGVAAVFTVMQLASSTSSAQNTSAHPITIVRWSNTNGNTALSNSEADTALSIASNILRVDADGGGALDVACNVTLSRSGAIGTFAEADGNISTLAEFNTLANDVNGFAKVVTTITFCNGSGNFGGCTRIGQRNGMLLTRAVTIGNTRGHAWAHEFGHSVGLDHVSNPNSNVMFGTLSTNVSGVTTAQCPFFRHDDVDYDGPGGSSALAALLSVQSSDEFQSSDESSPVDLFDSMIGLTIEDLAHTQISNTMPMVAADVYTQSDVGILREMLADSTESEHYPSIASLIGIISSGDDVDSEALITLASSEDRDPSATAAAYIALGYLAHQGSPLALDFLVDSAHTADSARADWAVQGLGLSGDPVALTTLLELEDEAARQGVQGRSFGASRAQLDQALADHEIVSTTGLRGYYGL